MQAMIEVVSERGYPETRVVDVIGVAGVSRKTFYELFDSKEDCFLAAYDVLLGNLLGDTAGGFESQARGALGRAGRRGAAARCSTTSPSTPTRPASRSSRCWPRGRRRWPGATPRCASSPASSTSGRAETSVELPGITSLSLAGGVNELLYSEILHGAAARLPSRLPDLMFWITLPFLGGRGRRPPSASACGSRCSRSRHFPAWASALFRRSGGLCNSPGW